MKWLFLLHFILMYHQFIAQEELIQDIENSVAEQEVEVNQEEITEDILHLLDQPIPINDTNQDLSLLVYYDIINPLQVQSITNYIRSYGPILSKTELVAIPDFTWEEARRLSHYVTLKTEVKNSVTIQEQVKNSKGTLVFRDQFVVEPQAGYQETDSTQSKYSGDKHRLYLKYKQSYQNKWSLGFLADKDPGESFFSESNTQGFDFYSGHVAYKPNQSALQQIIVGDYEIKLGQGLVQWNGFSLGKTSNSTMVYNKGYALRAYTSSNEYNFNRGAASYVDLNEQWSLLNWVSLKGLDAHSETDSTTDQNLTSIQTSGLHRTIGEINDEKRSNEILYGSALFYEREQWKIGVLAQQIRLRDSLVYTSQEYQKFLPKGKQFSYTSLFGNGLFHRWYWYGELAYSIEQKARAAQLGVQHRIAGGIETAVVLRDYSKSYYSPYANSLSEQSKINNERGLYMGLSYSPQKFWTFTMYYDLFQFPWNRYRVDRPSHGNELFFEANYQPHSTLEIEFQAKREQKEINDANSVFPSHSLNPFQKNSGRIECRFKPIPQLYTKSRFAVSGYQNSEKQEKGYVVLQDLIYNIPSGKLKFYGRMALFNTPSYDSRIYVYENDLLYNFSVPAYYGKGNRYYLMVRGKPIPNIDVWLKLGQTRFSDRTVISSGNNQIEGDKKTEIKMQIQWKFY